MKRLIVVDPSLTDFVGHHAQYDISVIENAETIGVKGLVLCHRSACDAIDQHVQVVRTFSEDMWGTCKSWRCSSFELKLFVLMCVSVSIIPSLLYTLVYRTLGNLRRWFAKMRIFNYWERSLYYFPQKGMNSSLAKFAIYALFGLVPGIFSIAKSDKEKTHKTHWVLQLLVPPVMWKGFNFSNNAVRKLKKLSMFLLPPILFKNMDVKSVAAFPFKVLYIAISLLAPKIIIQLSGGFVDKFRHSNFIGSLTPRVIFFVFGNHRYYLEAEEALLSSGLQLGDLVFFHMVIGRNILETAVLCEAIYSKTQVAPVVLLRYPPSFLASAPTILRSLAIRKFEYLFENGKLRLASDSERLIEEYAEVTYVPIELFPIPHGVVHLPERGDAPQKNERVTIAVLGNARGEKGFAEIYKMMKRLAESAENLPVQFMIQANDPDSVAAPYVRELKNARFPFPVSVITKSLDKNAYEALVAAADVILAPYWREIYSSRTSGVALEAIIGAKILITTEGTWMSDQVRLWRTGLTVENRNVESLTNAVQKAIFDRDGLMLTASSGREAAAKFHSGKNFIEHLMGRRLSRTESRKNVCFIYPWDNLFLCNSGASVRSSLMVKKIIEAGWCVTVFGKLPKSAVVQKDISVFQWDEITASFSNRVYLADYVQRLLLSPWMIGLEDFQYRFRLWMRSREAKLAINSMLRHSSAVVLEYPFLASLFMPFAKAYEIPMIINSHDILGMQTKRRKLRRWIIAKEVEALNFANFSSVICEADRQVVEKFGVRTHVVANAIDLTTITLLPYDEARKRIEDAGIEVPFEQFGLFVGSIHPPNIVAARRVAELSKNELLLAEGVGFVIAGNCGARQLEMKSQNCLQLGRIPGSILQALYTLASFVIIPLESGTGSSVKTIEAFAYGKAVIGTDVAFRGFDVISFQHCIISNDFDDYPRLITEFLRDLGKKKKMENCARHYATSKDYRANFQPIVDAITPVATFRWQYGAAEQVDTVKHQG
ncbi:MAG: glycosyltransferase [Acidiferrobacterales bacterium]